MVSCASFEAEDILNVGRHTNIANKDRLFSFPDSVLPKNAILYDYADHNLLLCLVLLDPTRLLY